MLRDDELHALFEQLASPGLAERLHAVSALRRELAEAETKLVAEALGAGWSWSRIGDALGVSKQAAHSRHRRPAAPADEAADTRPGGRHLVVSAEVRAAVRHARRAAATLGQASVGTEHLLLGLLAVDEGDAARLLRKHGATLPAARRALRATNEVPLAQARGARAPIRPSGGSTGRGPSPSALARRAIEEALGARAARDTGAVSGRDLLLAILHDQHGGAWRTLSRLGVPAGEIRSELAATAGGPDRVRPEDAE